MAGTSAIWPLHVALSAILTADVSVAALLGGDKVYSLIAPRGALFDYVVLGMTTTQDFPTFGRAGEKGAIQCHLWCAGADQRAVLQLYGELYRVLHNVPLTLTLGAARAFLGQLRMIATMADPSGEFSHGVIAYDFTTL